MNSTFFQRLNAIVFSMKSMSVALFIFLVAIGAATFIESIYGIQSAKIIIYNALWFEVLLTFLTINLIANIFRYQMWKPEKIAMFTFHISFIVIMIGAALTRYVGFEGMMVIREGTSSNFIYTADPHLLVFAQDKQSGTTKTIAEKKFMSIITDNDFEMNLDIKGKNVSVRYVDFQTRMIDSLVINQSFKETALELVTDGMQSNFVGEGDIFMIGAVPLAYQKTLETPGIEIRNNKDSMEIRTSVPIKYLPMWRMQESRKTGAPIADSSYVEIPLNKWSKFPTTTLYQVGNKQFVFKRSIPHAKKMLVSSGRKDVGSDYLTVELNDGKSKKTVQLEGGMSQIPTPERFELNGIIYQLEFGSIRKPIPFDVFCRDFQLDKYPGSESPSSFASELTVVDTKKKYERNVRVFMNNVMDYSGYRFFQSSYELDNPQTPENEEATKLSVNFDWWGTNVTYVGYLLMSIGMLLSLFAPIGRFRDLNQKLEKLNIRKTNLLATVLLFVAFNLQAQDSHNHHDNDGHHHAHDGHDHDHVELQNVEHNHTSNPKNKTKALFRVPSKEHVDKLSALLVLDYDGRVVPFHTLSDQILRKIYRDNKYKDLNAVQVVLSMHMYPQYWLEQPLVQVPSAVRERLKLKDYATPLELADEEGNFKWLKEYKIAHQKLESQRNEFDKKLIKLNEKFEVVQGVFTWQYMRIIPRKNDPENKWFLPASAEVLSQDSTATILAFQYLQSIDEAAKTKNFKKADEILASLIKQQRLDGKAVVPTERIVGIEISYNKMNIFKNTYRIYGLVGLLMLILFFIQIFNKRPKEQLKWFSNSRKFFVFTLIVFFIYHGVGLGFRWAISGHAPWSNGYEAMVFIAWVTMIAGFAFSKKNPAVLAGTAILASLIIFVSELNLLDPEITPLVPVLKSYWLMIHVAIITGSYGFLGLSFILGFFNLILYTARTRKNGELLTINISEITYISEMTMTVGLFMLTIGTFLGGVWANESWGRYWGWDPKETWALVSVLVYAIILHLRFIPALNGKFLFNVVSFWGYSAILFTFFGVNFMLVGLHSYAQGEGLGKFPTWLLVTIFVLAIFTTIAAIRNSSYNKALKNG